MPSDAQDTPIPFPHTTGAWRCWSSLHAAAVQPAAAKMGCAHSSRPDTEAPAPRNSRRSTTPTTSIMVNAIKDATAPAAAPSSARALPQDDPTAGSHRDDDEAEASHIRLDVAALQAANASAPTAALRVTPRKLSIPPRMDEASEVDRASQQSQHSDRPVMDGHEDGVSWLYEQGKQAFERKEYDVALTTFACAHLLRRHSNSRCPLCALRTA